MDRIALRKKLMEQCTPSFSLFVDKHLRAGAPFRRELEAVRDASGMEQTVAWAHYVKAHPRSWKRIHTDFINTAYKNFFAALAALERQNGGKEKIARRYGIKNKKGYPKLLG